ncbi:MAG: hypothetical protein R3345_07295 [Fulvivirga sp.]|nr:hypothetical protein [Fulvivirga sp.]
MSIKYHYFLTFFVFSFLSAYSQDLYKENLGPKINTKYNETKPIISPDGKILYFARQNCPQNIKGEKDPQDIYYAIQTDGQ